MNILILKKKIIDIGLGDKFMILIYEKRTNFNRIEFISDFKEAKIKNIKHKISRIKDFNIKTSKQKIIPNISHKKLVFLKDFDHKTILQTFLNPKSNIVKTEGNEEEGYFTLIYDEVVDILTKSDKIEGQNEENRNKQSLSHKLGEEVGFNSMNQILSPKNSKFSKKKLEIKLLRSMKIRKGGNNSISISPNLVTNIKFK